MDKKEWLLLLLPRPQHTYGSSTGGETLLVEVCLKGVNVPPGFGSAVNLHRYLINSGQTFQGAVINNIIFGAFTVHLQQVASFYTVLAKYIGKRN